MAGGGGPGPPLLPPVPSLTEGGFWMQRTMLDRTMTEPGELDQRQAACAGPERRKNLGLGSESLRVQDGGSRPSNPAQGPPEGRRLHAHTPHSQPTARGRGRRSHSEGSRMS